MAAASARSPQGNTVTVTVRQGDSPNPTATFSATMAARSVLVGSGAEAQWKLRGSGVEAVHAELYWDGSKLFVRDPGSRSGVYVGVERADEWKQLYDGSEVTFGQAVLQTRVVGPDARPPVDPAVDAATNFYNAPPPSSMADDEEGTAVLGKKNLVAAAGAFSPPRSTSAPGPRPPVSVPQVPPRVATLAPSRNPSSPLPAVPPLSRPAEAPAPPLVAAPVAQETVIRMSPYAPQEPARPAPAAGSKAPTAPLSEERTVMHEGLAAVAANIPPPTVRAPTLGPAVGIAGASSPLMNPLAPAPSFSANGTSPSLQASRPRNSTPAPGGGVDDPFADAFPPPSGKGLVTDDGTGPKLLGMPTRTWILVGGTLVVALLANLLGPPAPTRGAAAVPQIQVESVGSTPPASNNILGLPTGASGMVGVILVRPLPTTDASGRPAALPPSNPQDPLRLAAEAVNAHRYDQAAGMYEALAREHREAPLFQQFAVVLRARVANPTCTPGAPGCPLPASPTPPANPATPQAPGVPAPAP